MRAAPAAVLIVCVLLPGAARGVEFRVTERLTVQQGLEVSTSATASPLLFISSTTGAGNVGIGTTNPGAKLAVLGTPSATLLELSTGAAASQRVMDIGIFDGKPTITSEWANLPLRFKARGGDQPDLVVATSGNLGIGMAIPEYKLDVGGDVRLSAELIYGNSESRTQTRNDAGLQGNAGAKSGFFETSVPAPAANWYPGASSWQHLIDVRHSNTGNNYAMQFAGSFFDQNLYFRKTNSSPSAAWRRVVLEAAAGVVFSYTGADQFYTVPAGVTSITVKMWGAGGGGGNFGGWNFGFPGGAGGFTQGTIAVTPAQVLTVIVGQGGLDGTNVLLTGTYGGGARSCNTGSDCRYGGQGGGRSAIRAGAAELLTAGGGGGGGASRTAAITNDGGAGGGRFGENGTSDQAPNGKAMRGTQTAGGPGGTGTAAGSAGAQFAGGNPGSNAYGGGGGGGWYGGGGGAYTEGDMMGGGGGGSGYVGGAGVSNAVTIPGSKMTPPETRDFHYVPGVAVGGAPAGTPASTGGNGLVVISPN